MIAAILIIAVWLFLILVGFGLCRAAIRRTPGGWRH